MLGHETLTAKYGEMFVLPCHPADWTLATVDVPAHHRPPATRADQLGIFNWSHASSMGALKFGVRAVSSLQTIPACRNVP